MDGWIGAYRSIGVCIDVRVGRHIGAFIVIDCIYYRNCQHNFSDRDKIIGRDGLGDIQRKHVIQYYR